MLITAPNGRRKTSTTKRLSTKTRMRHRAADPADEIEHLAQLHSSGVLTDEEFATAKAKVLGS